MPLHFADRINSLVGIAHQCYYHQYSPTSHRLKLFAPQAPREVSVLAKKKIGIRIRWKRKIRTPSQSQRTADGQQLSLPSRKQSARLDLGDVLDDRTMIYGDRHTFDSRLVPHHSSFRQRQPIHLLDRGSQADSFHTFYHRKI